MTKFLSTPLVRTLTAIVVFVSTINADLRGRLPDSALILNVSGDYERPAYHKSFDTVTDHHNKKQRKLYKADIKSIIKKKIKKLKPQLDEQTELFSDPDDDQKTSIIKISPFLEIRARDKNSSRPETVKDAIEKYKKLRREIENVLKKESVSVNSKHLVTTTLDRLISQMINSQCNLHSDANKVPESRAQGSFLKVDKAEMLKSWTNKWQDLIKQYSTSSQDSEAGVGAGYKEMILFLIRLREFFFQIHDELNMLNDRYMVKCQLTEKVPQLSKEDVDLRSRDKNGNDFCNYIKICSDELKGFMIEFYMNLKETIDTVFKNYVEMYKRDITTATRDQKRVFAKMIEGINDHVIIEIDQSFQNETINLDQKHNKSMNKYNILKNFIQTTVTNVQKISEKVINTALEPLEDRLRSTVTQDLRTSIRIELKKLNTEKIGKICSTFKTCNGIPMRNPDEDPKNSLAFGKNNINVKLKIGFEDLPSSNAKKERRTFEGKVNNRYQRSSPKPPFDLGKYAHIKVTRTKHTSRPHQPSTGTTAQTITTTNSTTTSNTS